MSKNRVTTTATGAGGDTAGSGGGGGSVPTKAAEQEANRDQLTFGLESLLVDLATDKWVAELKPQDLKPEVNSVLAGMLLAYTVRARSLHTQMVELAATIAKGGK